MFFFFKQKTAYEMRISDWSSDVCSSDLFHSEVCIWKDPVVAQQRTKSIRLLHKQIVKDSTISGQGLADYIVTFRKPGENAEPVSGCFDEWHGEGDGPDPSKFTTSTDGRNWYSIEVWQRYASPVWMDINQSRTLQYRSGRDSDDEIGRAHA